MSMRLVVKQPLGTLNINKDMDLKKWVEILHKAMKGFGTDEDKLIDFFTQTSHHQRSLISDLYFQEYKKNLFDQIKSELSGDFKQLALDLMKPQTEMIYDCMLYATKGFNVNEYFLIAILLSRSNAEKLQLMNFFESTKEKSLFSHIESKTKGVIQSFLLGLISNNREELSNSFNEDYIYNNNVEQILDRDLAVDQAKLLNEQLSSKKKIKDAYFLTKIFHIQNRYSAAACIQEYRKLTGHNLSDAAKNMDKDLKMLLELIVSWVLHPVGFYCDVINYSTEGLGTNEKMLNFVIVDRREKDLKNIINEYETSTGKSFAKLISSETSGDYCKLLHNLIQ